MVGEVRLEYRLIDPDAKPPARFRETDAAFDLYSIESGTIKPLHHRFFKIGIQIAAPPGYYWTIESRSGLIKNGVFAMRGIIDATYTGEVIVCLFNMNENPISIEKGDRIAQMILHNMVIPYFVEVEEFSNEYNQRGEAGWGSSGQ